MEWTALLLGLGGGLHCAGMCGPLVLALPGPRAPGALLRRVCYQLGRVITYALLGAAAGSLGKSLTVFGIGRWVSLAAGFSIAIGVLWSQRMGGGVWWIRQLGQWRQRVVPYLRPTSVGAFAVFGAFNGLLPCGLVYVACAAASASGGILAGAGDMIWIGNDADTFGVIPFPASTFSGYSTATTGLFPGLNWLGIGLVDFAGSRAGHSVPKPCHRGSVS